MSKLSYTINKGDILTAYDGREYNPRGEGTFTVADVSPAEEWPGERGLWHFVMAIPNRKDGQPGKKIKSFLVSPTGSIKPAKN